MNTPIIVDREDPKWLLLEQIMNLTTSRQVKQAMARHGVVPVEKAGTILRILFISMFFSVDITYVLQELGKRHALRGFAHVSNIPSASTVCQFISSFEDHQFILLISDILNPLCKQPSHRTRHYCLYAFSCTLDPHTTPRCMKGSWTN
jgi:hypothetical protein